MGHQRPAIGAPQVGGVTLGLLVGFAPIPFIGGGKGEGGEEEKERGAPPPPLVQFGLLPWGGHPLGAGLPPSYGPYGPYLPPGGSVTPRYSDMYPIQSETLPVSEYYHTIYQSLPLDHFETPRHVRVLIQDTEQHLVNKTHNSYNTNRHRTLSVWTLWVRELCRHDRDTSLVNNQ